MKNKHHIKKAETAPKDLSIEVEPTFIDQLREAMKLYESGKNIESSAIKKMSGFDKYSAAFAVLGYLLVPTTQKIETEEDRKQAKREANKKLDMMAALGPKDGFEGMLIAQMIKVFRNSMDLLEKANSTDSFEFHNSMLNQSTKLMKLYTQQLESLDKHRRGGKQKMIVEHVHVHDGGQAIVGEVHQGGKDEK